MPSSNGRQPYQVQSLERAFGILECFSLRRPELSLGEICEMTGLPKPTVFRLLAALEGVRFVARTRDGLRYQVGIRAFELGSIFVAHLSVEHIARPYMESLTKRYGMACNLAILDDGQVVYVATLDDTDPLLYRPVIGHRHYVHCSALGKALIAEMPEEEVRSILRRRGMPALTSHTITDEDRLLAHLDAVRSQRYAIDDQEGGIGTCCLAVSLRDYQGRVFAAVSLSGSRSLFTAEMTTEIATDLQDATQQISRQLGWQMPSGSDQA